jgi:hypothetical protein
MDMDQIPRTSRSDLWMKDARLKFNDSDDSVTQAGVAGMSKKYQETGTSKLIVFLNKMIVIYH